MEFKIVETYRNHNFIDFLKQSIANVFLFLIGMIIIPTVLIVTFFKKKNKQPIDEILTEENEWFEFMKSEKLIFYRQAIDDEDLPDDIELPEDTYDIYAFKIRTEPEIKEFSLSPTTLNEISSAYKNEEPSSEYWKNKYLKLLEDYSELLKAKKE